MVLVGFIFVAPLAALAALAGAASIPILIHLFSRKRFRIVPWAAMRFLLAAQRQNVRRMRLEHILLLAVRTLIIALLVLAMASVMPWAEEFWHRWFPESVARAAAGRPRTHKIVVLDGSLSMAAKPDEAALFERARAMALEIVQHSPSGDGFSVVLMAEPPVAVVPEPSEAAGRVAEEIGKLRLPHGNANVAATLGLVDDMVRRSPAKFEAREVYFLSDLQRTTWTAARSGELAETLQRLDSRARAIFVDVGQDNLANLAVTQLGMGVPLTTSGTVTPITATIHNFGGDDQKQVRVELLVGRARATAADPPFAPRVVQQQSVTVPPGKTGVAVSFSYKFPNPGDYVVQVRLENDVLELDDVRSFVVAVKDQVPVMLVNGKPAVELYDRATEWLRDALNPFQGGPVPRNLPARPRVVSDAQFADATLGDLTPFDCVFLCDVARLTEGEVSRLETHLRRGGGVVICLGPNVDLEAYNRRLFRKNERDAEGILPARLLGFQRAAADRMFTFYADEDAYRRPPLDAFAGDDDRTGLQIPRFRQYVRAELAPKGQARKVLSFMPEPLTAAAAKKTIADGTALPAGDPALIEWPRYRGRVLLLTTTVNMEWTTWPVSPSYLPMMQELLRYAVAGKLREQTAQVGQSLEEYLSPASGGLDVTLTTPDGRTVATQTRTLDDAALFRFSDTDQSGLYRAVIGLHPQEYLFAVNVPTATEGQLATESDLSRASTAELQETFPGWDFQRVRSLGEVIHASGPVPVSGEPTVHGLGPLIARDLLLAMLVLLMLEVALAWKFGHHGAVTTAHAAPPASGRLLPGAIGLLAGLLFVGLAVVLIHASQADEFLSFLPDGARQGLENWLGVAPPVSGEGTHWRLEFTPYLLRDPAMDPWLIGGLAILAVALIVLIYSREGPTAGLGSRLLFGGLRLFVVLLTLLVLLPQLRLVFERQGWPDLVLLIDDSQSMSVTDRYRDLNVREAAERLAKAAAISEPRRLELAKALLIPPEQTEEVVHPDWLEQLLTRRKFKIHVYHCSTRAARIADVVASEDRPNAIHAIQELKAEGKTSQLGDAVREVIGHFRGSALVAVIMLTDGVTTDGDDLTTAARYASQMGVPLFFVGIGDSHEVRDLILHDLQVEDTVYVNDRLVFEVRLTAQGYSALTVPVTLYEKTKDDNLKMLAREMVAADPNGKPVKVRLMHQPTEAGEVDYVIDVPVQPDEAAPADNNRVERTIVVRDAKIIKVLYVEGYPRYQYRYIKALLEREANEPRNKSIELNVVLLDADPEYATQDRSARADIPPKIELNQYDVVLWGDIDPRHPKVLDKNLQNLADFVRERGGGLLMLAGPRHNPQSYRDTPLKDVLPISLVAEDGDSRSRDFNDPFRPQLTPVGRLHPIFRFSPDEAENVTIWEQLPELYWYAEGYRTQPAAEVLAVHPTQLVQGPRKPGSGISDERHALMVQQFVGAGRCMFLGLDETWRWRFREHELRFNQFWYQTVRYLSRSRLGRVELRLDRQTPYRRGEPIRVTVRFPDDQPPPDTATVVKVVAERKPLRKPGDAAGPAETEVQTLQLSKVEGSRATFEALLPRTPEGEYRFWLSTPPVTGSKPRAECRVLDPPGEMDRLRMNQPGMEQAAERTQGHFYNLADAERLIDELPAGARVSLNAPRPPWLLWNHVAMFGLVIGLLTAEWVLRKRKHLL